MPWQLWLIIAPFAGCIILACLYWLFLHFSRARNTQPSVAPVYTNRSVALRRSGVFRLTDKGFLLLQALRDHLPEVQQDPRPREDTFVIDIEPEPFWDTLHILQGIYRGYTLPASMPNCNRILTSLLHRGFIEYN